MSVAGKSKGRSAPEPSGAWPFLGHLPLLRGPISIFRTLAAMADKHGPVFMIRLGMHRAVLVSSREAVKQCFTTNDKLLGYNYAMLTFAPYGVFWREMRKLFMMKILSARPLDALKHV